MNQPARPRRRAAASTLLVVLSIALFLPGVALAGTWIWADFFSGTRARLHDLELGKPLSLALTPNMSPVGLKLRGDPDSISRTQNYEMSLHRLVEPSTELIFEVGVTVDPPEDESGSGSSVTLRVGPLLSPSLSKLEVVHVDEPSDYEFVLTRQSRMTTREVSRLQLEVRHGVLPFPLGLRFAAIGALFAGALLFMFARSRA